MARRYHYPSHNNLPKEGCRSNGIVCRDMSCYKCELYGIGLDFEGINVDHLQQLLGRARRDDNQRCVEDNIIVAPSYWYHSAKLLHPYQSTASAGNNSVRLIEQENNYYWKQHGAIGNNTTRNNPPKQASISLPSTVGRGVPVSAVSKAVADTVVLCISESSAQHMVHRCESDFSLLATVIAKK